MVLFVGLVPATFSGSMLMCVCVCVCFRVLTLHVMISAGVQVCTRTQSLAHKCTCTDDRTHALSARTRSRTLGAYTLTCARMDAWHGAETTSGRLTSPCCTARIVTLSIIT